MTRPFGTVFDLALVTLPVRQWAAAIDRLAFASVLRFTFGTTQETRRTTLVKVATAFFAASIVTVQEPAPVQAPVHPANFDQTLLLRSP
jgi:hypothetical protein